MHTIMLSRTTSLCESEQATPQEWGNILETIRVPYMLHVVGEMQNFCSIILRSCSSKHHAKGGQDVLHTPKISLRNCTSNFGNIHQVVNQSTCVFANSIES